MQTPAKMRRGGRANYFHRRLRVEPLEDRRMLSVGSLDQELFNTTSATFIQNEGQWTDETVRYAFLGDAANVLHTDMGPVIQLFKQEEAPVGQALPDEADLEDSRSSTPCLTADNVRHGVPDLHFDPDSTITESISLSVTFDGAGAIEPTGTDLAETYYNFFLGDESAWREGVSSYETVAYLGLYEGIDLLTFGQRDSLKYEFHVAPGADYRQIQISYAGSDGLSIDADGQLHVQTSFGDLVDEAPYVYQVVDGCQIEVAGQFVLFDADTYGFEITGDYDASLELVIDPDLDWGSFLGGLGNDGGYAITADSAGDIYVCGYTTSSSWNAPGEWESSYSADYDGFLVKLSGDGSHLWSTYLGGSDTDEATDVVTDSVGNVYVCGFTQSADWVPAGNLDNTYNDTYNGTEDWGDGFLIKFDSEGNPDWGTYIGGTEPDGASSVALDNAGNVYVCGDTQSTDWEVTSPQASQYGDDKDGYVVKYSNDGQQCLWKTYLGGNGEDVAWGVATDDSGDVFVCGYTRSAIWGDVEIFGSTHLQGEIDGFLAKLSSSDGDTLWGTYLGGFVDEEDPDPTWPQEAACRVATDASGNVYACGYTRSTGWSIDGEFSNTIAGEYDGYLVKFSSSGTFLQGNYLGGSAADRARGLILDDDGNVYVCGETESTDWELSGAWDSTYGGDSDGFLIKLLPSGTPAWGTYLGDTEYEMALDVAIDPEGDVYTCGLTGSELWDISGGWQSDYGGGNPDNYEYDGFIVKLSNALIVSTLDDNNDGDYSDGQFSLREALLLAAQRPGDDVIRFKDTLFENNPDATIALREEANYGQLEINSSVDIQGPGADQLTIDGGGHDRVFYVSSGVTATISGLTITGGYKDEWSEDEAGGGMYVDEDASVTIARCTFLHNTAAYAGGALKAVWADLYIVNTQFLGNDGGNGGALSFASCDSVIVANCTFIGNHAENGVGGAVDARWSGGKFTNCTFTANHGGNGGAFCLRNTQFDISNCILWDNTAVHFGSEVYVWNLYEFDASGFSYCDIQGGINGSGFDSSKGTHTATDGGGNIDYDPLFVRAPDPGDDEQWGTQDDDYGDLRLSILSPCVDAGDNDALPEDAHDLDDDGNSTEPLPLDLGDSTRRYDVASVSDTGNGASPIVDIGAYELQVLVVSGTITICDLEGNLLLDRALLPDKITVTVTANASADYDWPTGTVLGTEEFTILGSSSETAVFDIYPYNLPVSALDPGTTYTIDFSVYGSDHKLIQFQTQNCSNVDATLTYEDVESILALPFRQTELVIKYYFVPEDWPDEAECNAVRRAMKTWSDTSVVSLMEVTNESDKPDIWLYKRWTRAELGAYMGGDPPNAWTWPYPYISCFDYYWDIQFATDVSWVTSQELWLNERSFQDTYGQTREGLLWATGLLKNNYSIESAALHEIGHVLGLRCSERDSWYKSEGPFGDSDAQQWSIMDYLSCSNGTIFWLGWSDVAALAAINDTSLKATTTCPVDIIITDSDGNVASKDLIEITGATYVEDDLNADGDPDDQITIPAPTTQAYYITVVPEEGADPDELVTLIVEDHGVRTILLDNVRVGDLTGVPIPVSVDRTAPVVTVDMLATTDPTPALSGTVDDPLAEVWIYVEGNPYEATNHGDGTWTLADDQISPSLFSGVYDVVVASADTTGNSATDQSTDELTIDASSTTTARIDTVVLREPSAGQDPTTGEVAALPDSEEWIDEWDTHWVEVWISTPASNDAGIVAAEVDLSYRVDCFTATAIEYGPAFTENQTGTIDTGNGLIHDLGASTTLTDVGDDQFVLLARVRFDSSTEANAAGLLIPVDASIEPYACNIVLSNAQVMIVGDVSANVEWGGAPQTELWPVMFDLDDDGEVGLGDLSYFASTYNHVMSDLGINYLHASDFDQDGEIGLGDLSHFAAAYHAQHFDTTSMLDCYFDGFPADWRIGGSLAQPLSSDVDEGGDDVFLSLADSLLERSTSVVPSAHDAVLAEENLMIEATGLEHQQLAWSFASVRRQAGEQRKSTREGQANPASELLLMYGE